MHTVLEGRLHLTNINANTDAERGETFTSFG